MKHQELTPIIGKPTYNSIRKIEREVIANTQCATTTLGGGNHRYLGLAKNPTAYALLSNTPFVKPTNPGQFTPSENTTGPQIYYLQH
mmetsp:Transcript_6273/g.9112  ORF Transcript_6273/g.9112 Transcript_6273/m.9112 type:complete len:87 (+) Transcript_6273:404-664(+)